VRLAVKGIIVPTLGTDLTTAPGHITEEAQSWSPLAIDLIIAVPVTGTDERITSGNQVTGHGGMVSKYGSAAITSCEDTEPRSSASPPRHGLPGRDQSPQQAKKSANERFQKIMAP
jgi:hypothetical protein